MEDLNVENQNFKLIDQLKELHLELKNNCLKELENIKLSKPLEDPQKTTSLKNDCKNLLVLLTMLPILIVLWYYALKQYSL
jgi:hypothetical protein